MRDTRGAIVVARQILDSEVFLKPDKWLKIWLFILLSANYKDVKKFRRGELFTTYKEIMSYTKATRSEVDHCIRWLKQATQIKTWKATRGFYIKVLKYDVYQTLNTYKSDTRSDDDGDIKATGRRYRSDTISNIREEGKKDKKGEEQVDRAPPAIISATFFKGVQDLRAQIPSEEGIITQKFLKELQQKHEGVDKQVIWLEIKKFEQYWTEKNSTGKKQLWQQQKTFEVDRRLVTWFQKVKGFASGAEINKDKEILL